MDNHQDKAAIGTDAFRTFVQEFGPDDVYHRTIIEILLEELMSKSSNISSGKSNELFTNKQNVNKVKSNEE